MLWLWVSVSLYSLSTLLCRSSATITPAPTNTLDESHLFRIFTITDIFNGKFPLETHAPCHRLSQCSLRGSIVTKYNEYNELVRLGSHQIQALTMKVLSCMFLRIPQSFITAPVLAEVLIECLHVPFVPISSLYICVKLFIRILLH